MYNRMDRGKKMDVEWALNQDIVEQVSENRDIYNLSLIHILLN